MNVEDKRIRVSAMVDEVAHLKFKEAKELLPSQCPNFSKFIDYLLSKYGFDMLMKLAISEEKGDELSIRWKRLEKNYEEERRHFIKSEELKKLGDFPTDKMVISAVKKLRYLNHHKIAQSILETYKVEDYK